jgi:hypothetical protein
MDWFQQICRNVGLMVHNIKHPDRPGLGEPQRRVVKKTLEEKQLNETTTLRRTTVEEIEIKQEPPA